MSVRLFNHYLPLPLVLLALADLVICYLSIYVAAALLPGFDETQALWISAAIFSSVSVVAMLSLGLYRSGQRFLLAGSLMRVIASIATGVAGSALAFYLMPVLSIDRTLIFLSAFVALSGTSFVRMIFYRVIDEDLFKRRVLVYGSGVRAASITRLRRRSDQRGFHITGFVHAEGDMDSVPADKVVHIVGPLLAHAESAQVDEVVVAMDDRRRKFPISEFLDCKLHGIDVTDLVSFLERESGKVNLEVLNPSWLIFSEGFRKSALRSFIRRLFDLIASSVLLLLTWPFMLLTAIAVWVESGFRGSVLYRQQRVGLDGEPFELVKFRSMGEDAEKEGSPQWASENDARVTRVGQVIRRSRLDELPQLINVLRGDMSFVGPRPERPEFVSKFNHIVPYYRERHCVKPGITGWAQLCYPYGSSEKDALEKLQFDLYYVKNHSLVFDLIILLQTVEVIIWRKGAR